MRREKIVEISDVGSRDHGKKFKITEMDAESAENWAADVLFAVMDSDVEIDFQAPLANLASQGLRALAKIKKSFNFWVFSVIIPVALESSSGNDKRL